MLRTLVMLLLAAQTAASAQEAAPTPTLAIAPGETVTVRIADNDAGFVVLSRGQGEASGARAENTIRFSFVGMSGMLMLQVENGYGRAFTYEARMVRGRRAERTSICPVLAHIVTIESWQDAIDRLELSAPHLSDQVAMACR